MAEAVAQILDPGERLLGEIRSIHLQYPLCGSCGGGKDMLHLDDALLTYLISLLSGGQAEPPVCTLDQWEQLLVNLRCHWINPFLYWRIMMSPGGGKPPVPVMNALKNAYYNSTARNITVEKQLADIAGAFGKEGIEFLALKGVAVSRTAYPDRFTRYGSDIDILVRPGDVRRARRAMDVAGYACQCPLFDVSGSYYKEEIFFSGKPGQGYLPVEVHWNLSCPPYDSFTDVERYFARSVTAKAGRAEIRVMDPGDALMFSSMHMMAHHGDNLRLSWINDIAWLCRQLPVWGGWEELVARNREPWAGLMLRPTLRMAELWCGAEVPAWVYDAWPAPDKKTAETFANIVRRRKTLLSHLRASWPAGIPLQERFRLIRHFVLPPERLLRTQFFPGQDISLPAAHFKRWMQIAGWKFDH